MRQDEAIVARVDRFMQKPTDRYLTWSCEPEFLTPVHTQCTYLAQDQVLVDSSQLMPVAKWTAHLVVDPRFLCSEKPFARL